MARNPYSGLPDQHFWSRAVAMAPPGQLDPMVSAPKIAPDARVVTIGSCFAQHLARNLPSLGLNYHVAEPAPEGMSDEEATRRNFGVFSARFGNIYTVRQGVQMFERAFGRFVPYDDVWETAGGFVDAFRPQIEPQPLASAEAVREAALAHLAHVRDMFEQCDWLIFTLGLTAAWRSVHDDAVYPVAPGVGGGEYDAGRYEFVNFGFEAVKRDLIRFVESLHKVNPNCQVILTVSPVPLIATYTKMHVLSATTYSKSVLRAVAGEVEALYPHVTYFPSYEVITSPSAQGAYFEDDMRSISEIGVQHVMRVFRRHFTGDAAAAPTMPVVQPSTPTAAGNAPGRVICDEELIEKAIQDAGLTAEPPLPAQPAPPPPTRHPRRRPLGHLPGRPSRARRRSHRRHLQAGSSGCSAIDPADRWKRPRSASSIGQVISCARRVRPASQRCWLRSSRHPGWRWSGSAWRLALTA